MGHKLDNHLKKSQAIIKVAIISIVVILLTSFVVQTYTIEKMKPDPDAVQMNLRSGVCHRANQRWFGRMVEYKEYKNMYECIAAGGKPNGNYE